VRQRLTLIRDAKPADIDAIYQIEKENFNRPWSEISLMNEFKKQKSDFLVYEINGLVAGYIIFWYILDEAEIGIISVSKDHQRKGIAVELLKYCISMHPEVNRIYLEVDKTNSGAISLYNKFGFKTTGYIKNYYGNGKDAQRMALSF